MEDYQNEKALSYVLSATLFASFAIPEFSADKEVCRPDVYVDGKIVEYADQSACITDESRIFVPTRLMNDRTVNPLCAVS